ncbi:hypothetical protein RRG08_010750 [Elysia crispata]|uniref:Uncharacterized protein n=1 Tax=Elysia crispata TaxID=231223 RepID=A0AAE0ZGL0_9GAST|nr:hypothetical protein RRG08_010750 [Elysia crispata]
MSVAELASLQRHKSAPPVTRGDKAAADNRGVRATQKPEIHTSSRAAADRELLLPEGRGNELQPYLT